PPPESIGYEAVDRPREWRRGAHPTCATKSEASRARSGRVSVSGSGSPDGFLARMTEFLCDRFHRAAFQAASGSGFDMRPGTGFFPVGRDASHALTSSSVQTRVFALN